MPRGQRPLEEYDRKRDFSRTPEPPPAVPPRKGESLTFVVQKHAAARAGLHYDLRLEVDGVTKSWPVRKGPSPRPGDKRFAPMTEDHPLDYSTFEGVIPAGAYGGGPVIVWDDGTYSPDEDGLLFHDREAAEAAMRRGIEAGKLSVTFRGQKLKGSWALVRMKPRKPGENSWLLLKHRDDAADPEGDLTVLDRSVRSGLTIDDLKAGRLPDGVSRPGWTVRPEELPGASPAAFSEDIMPMQAESVDRPFSNGDWLFEPKMDGVRSLALLRAGSVTLRSRRGLDATAQYPSVAAEVARQPAHEAIFDGEIVALDERGVPSFQRLQDRINLTAPADVARAEERTPVLYYVFDLLYLDGIDLRRVPLDERKALLKRVLLPMPHVRLLEHFERDGIPAHEAARSLGLEGIVAKRHDSAYESGRRSRQWLKVKDRTTDEFVIGGFMAGQGARGKTFGSVLLGARDEDGGLRYVGNAGSGFDERTLAQVKGRLDALITKESPFAERLPRLGQPVTYVRPELVAEVAYAERTRDGRLRAPVFMRLRDDKAPDEVASISAGANGALPAPDNSATTEADPLQRDIASVLAQLEDGRKQFTLDVGGVPVKVTNLDKVFWPPHEGQRALTKRDLLVYYATAAPWLLRYLRDRPLTLTRYPNGIEGGSFYQKHYADAPSFVERVELFSEHNGRDDTYLLANNLATLVWLGQVADIALHTSLARVSPEPDGHHLSAVFTGSVEQIDASLLNYPDFVLFDLDPYIYSGLEAPGEEPELNRAAWDKTCQAARWIKELLDGASLESFVKTSGATGLHIYVPIMRTFDYDAVRSICDTLGRFVRQAHPGELTVEWSVPKRA